MSLDRTMDGDADRRPDAVDRVAEHLLPLRHHLALFLDFDGTLVAIAPTPDAITVAPDLPRLLERISGHLGGALAILSGRRIADIDAHLGLPVLPMAGQHGLEGRHLNGERWGTLPQTGLGDVLSRLKRFARDRPGVLIEDKGLTIAVHTRQAPEHARDARHLVADLADEGGWTVRPGHHVVEIGQGGADKGSALRALAGRPAFQGRVPVMFGDDITDDAAFRAARDLGGMAVAVGPRPAPAHLRLGGPGDVRAVLERLDGAFRA